MTASSQIDWENCIEPCIAILRKHSHYPSALDQITKEVDSRITFEKLREAFRRAGKMKPKDYTLQNLVRPAAELAVAARPKADDGLGMSKPNQKSLAARQGLVITDELEDMVREHLEEYAVKRELRRAAKDITTIENVTSDWMVKQKLAHQHLAIAPRDLKIAKPVIDSGSPVLIVPISDIHVGKKSQYKKKSLQYGIEYAVPRLQRLMTIIDRKRYQGNFSYETPVVIAVLGDVFESLLGNMRAGQGIGLESSGFEQYKNTRDLLLWFISSFEQYKNVSIYLVGGNHDRLTMEKDQNTEDMMMQLLADNIGSLVRQIKQGDWTITACEPIQSLELPHTEILMQHGHRSRNVNENATRRLIEVHGKTTKRKLVMQGHYHSFKVESGFKWRSVTLPAFCGADDWSSMNLLREQRAEAVFFLSTKQDDEIYGPFALDEQ
jgi:UDP-2,3-diacylglucosamine pyrophosphatase LpxH